MGWKDFYRRRDAIDDVLERAGRDPDGGLPFTGPATEVFASQADLLLALHYKWTMALTGRIGVALAEADRDPGIDRVDAVTGAWRRTAAAHPVLRRLLDEAANEPAMRPAVEGEQRLLALSAGLAGPAESVEDVTRTGAAVLALVRAVPEPRQCRRGAAGLLRRLVPSA